MQKARNLSLVQDRFEVIFRRFGVEIADQTMCGWMRQSAELLEPLYLRLKQFVRSFVASCELAKVDPFVWFQDVLTRIGACSIQLLDALLPHRWAAARD
jgi:IS66 C-terminal element/Transposase IS66 family